MRYIQDMDLDFNELLERLIKKTDELFDMAGDDDDKIKNVISLKIKQYRARKKITQAELAKKMLVSKMQIIRWENGKNMPSKLAQEKMKELGIL